MTMVPEMLQALYLRVETLQDFITSRVSEECSTDLVQTEDSTDYVAMLGESLVCTDAGVPETTNIFCCVQLSSQTDVILRVIQKLRRKRNQAKNLVMFGFREMTSNPGAQVSRCTNLEYIYPNHHVSRLQLPVWTTLLQRIGDDLMSHLLETRAIFIPADNKCWIQATGRPVYDMWQYPENVSVKSMADTCSNQSVPSNGSKRRHYRTTQERSKKKKKKKLKLPKLPPIYEVLRERPTDYKQCYMQQYENGIARSQDDIGSTTDKVEGHCQRSGKRRRCDTEGEVPPVKKPCLSDVTSEEQRISGGFENYNVCDKLLPTTSSQNLCLAGHSRSVPPVNASILSDRTSPHGDTSPESDQLVKNSRIFASGSDHVQSSGHVTNKMSDHVTRELGTDWLNDEVYWTDLNISDHVDSLNYTNFDESSICAENIKTSNCTGRMEPLSGTDTHVTIQDNCVSDVTSRMPTALTMEAQAVPEPVIIQDPGNRQARFSSNASFDKSVIFYARDMRERFPVGKVAELFRQGPEGLIRDIISVNLAHIVSCSCIPGERTVEKGVSDVQPLAPANLHHFTLLLHKLLNNISSSQKFISTLLDQMKDAPCDALNHMDPCDSPNGFTIPDLSGPVFARGSHKHTAFNVPSQESLFSSLCGSSQGRTVDRDQDLSESVIREMITQHDKRPQGGPSMAVLLESHTPVKQVGGLMRTVLTKIIPEQLLGRKNLKMFISAVEKFVGLGRFEKFYVGNLTNRLKTSLVPWLQGINHMEQMTYLSRLVAWIHTHIVMAILQSYYYITESSIHRNHIFYYRKQVWLYIRELALKDYLGKGHLRPITKEEADTMVAGGRSLGVAQLRFLPKASTVRPIVNLGASLTVGKKCVSSINRQLQFLHGVLSYIKQKGADLGSSMFGLDDIYRTWRQFIQYRRQAGDSRPLFFTKVDIEGCYDSINQIKLHRLITNLLKQTSKEDYIMRRYCTLVTSGGVVKRMFQRQVRPLVDHIPDFTQWVQRTAQDDNKYNMIFVDQVMHGHQSLSDLLKQLEAHLFGNIVKIGEDYFLQTQGIVQGSMISTLLCSYYYGTMEREHLPIRNDELLIRQVDDFLFVTPYPDSAQKFLDTMVTGVPEYNCKVNPKKTVTNLNQAGPGVVCLPQSGQIVWCGLLFDTETLEVRVDYTRYNGLGIHDVMTLELQRTPGANMAHKLKSSLRPKCHGIFLDHELASVPVLVENTFSMFLLAAYKFHCYATELPHNRRVCDNLRFFTGVIRDLASYFKHCMQSKTSSQVENSPLTLYVLQWLCYKAFILKLEHHQSAYRGLLTWLRRQAIRLGKVVPIPDEQLPTDIPQEFMGLL